MDISNKLDWVILDQLSSIVGAEPTIADVEKLAGLHMANLLIWEKMRKGMRDRA